MTKKTILLIFTALLGSTVLLGDERFFESEFDSSIEKVLDQKLNRASDQTKDSIAEYPMDIKHEAPIPSGKRKFVDVDYSDVPLVDVVQEIARAKGVNVILPAGNAKIVSKLSIRLGRLSVKKAWKLLYTILDIAGYSMIKRRDGYRIDIKDKSKRSYRQPLPIYIGVAPDDLPDTDKKIQYLYYLSNVKVPETLAGDLYSLLSILLPNSKEFIRFLPQSNGLLLADTARNIKSAMNAVLELDKAGFKEEVDVIRLTHTSAQTVATLFNNNIIEVAQRQYGARGRGVGWRGKSRVDYFSPNTKIIPEVRLNSLIIVGTRQAINRVRDFIYKYVDVKLDSGKSILHTYKLKYLDALKFKGTLESIIRGQQALAQNQRQAQARAGGKTGIGPERFFDSVVVEADTSAVKSGQKMPYAGSNQLIIAARNDDWIRIKQLIEELDRPQPQVILEVLVADLTLDDERLLGSQTRTPASLNLPEIVPDGNLQFQSAQSTSPAADADAGGLHVDLMRNNLPNSYPPPTTLNPLADMSTPGSTIVTLSDNNGEAWSLLQILQLYNNSKILSHPHVIATNNKTATVKIGELRLIPGEATIGTGGAAIAPKREVPADLIVTIVPRITGGAVVNMQVDITLKEYVGETFNRIDRKVSTNANVKNGSILALGGLIRVETDQSLNEAPILGKIPILGWLFKRRAGNKKKNNLTVFIRPTVVEPRLRGGIDKYTKDYIRLAKDYVKDGMLFDTLRDPITRWFFKTGVDPESAIDVFAQEGMPDIIGSEMLADADAAKLPIFSRDPRKTVLAAMEGRTQETGQQEVYVPMPAPKTIVAAKEPEANVSVAAQQTQTESLEVSKGSPVSKPESPASVPVSTPAVEVVEDRDKQLRKLLAQFDNPLLKKDS